MARHPQTKIVTVIGISVLVFLAALAGWWVGVREHTATPATVAASAVSATPQAAAYVCPMHPHVTAHVAGTCPICGMELVPARSTADNTPAPTVQLSPAMAQNLAVRIERVASGTVLTEVYASGTIDRIMPPHDYALTAQVTGRVHALRIRAGDWIGEGTLIAEVDVPGYVQAQRDYLAARAGENPEQATQLRERLAAMGASDATLSALEEKRTPAKFIRVLAPQAGRIRAVRTKVGAQIASGAALATVQAPLMAHATLISHALGAYQVEPGNGVRVHLLQRPDKSWPGRVESIASRVAGIPYLSFGVSFAVPAHGAENNLFVYARVETGRRTRALRVPTAAVIRLENESRVVRALSDGRFESVRIETGIANGEWVEVKAGLTEGDEVVTSGQFLLDSEADLRAGLARLAPASAP